MTVDATQRVCQPRSEVFTDPTARMLLASDGLTTPLLEAALGTALHIRVLRQDVVSADRVSETVAQALRLDEDCAAVVRRSGLVDPNLTLVSVNHVVSEQSSATRFGIDGPGPIGYHLTARGVAQSRRVLWTGMARWIDGRPCIAKAYVIDVSSAPVCYIKECFNPDLISPDTCPDSSGSGEPEPVLVDEAHAGRSNDPGIPPADSGNRPARHQPPWPDPAAARRNTDRLRSLPPLVSAAECEALTTELAAAAAGRAFVLQLGDCAETFEMSDVQSLTDRQALAAASAAVLSYGRGITPVVIGRIAGEYAKPRSQPIEKGTGLHSYLGDMINGYNPDAASRTPDPGRMVDAYFHAAVTLNHLRTHPAPPVEATARLIRHAADVCDRHGPVRLLRDVADLLDMAMTASDGDRRGPLPGMRVSHEALLLDYEQALTRRGHDGRWWDSSAHLLWIGERTRDPAHAHIRFAELINNPVGVKLGPTTRPADVAALCRRLDPERKPGRLTLIPRLGADRTATMLPALLEAAAETGTPVCWICDPMHGNTFVTEQGIKTRRVDEVTSEIRAFFGACRATGVTPGGLHLETAPEPVTECVGGWQRLREDELATRYRTRCDPRLNAAQTLQCVTVAVDELGSWPL
ncbi:3-deoxy-7-phosphoheptulonate synthase [Nocardia mexicana]|uniref:3-deoxy-7-phosphoheptulonate synthase n=1 Tax=Nocardia mexicana TaxID=279262 RepID=UPI0014718223|nr:3-deoxy-7-phosphoheptulonate synthase [Nocardia mexicana]